MFHMRLSALCLAGWIGPGINQFAFVLSHVNGEFGTDTYGLIPHQTTVVAPLNLQQSKGGGTGKLFRPRLLLSSLAGVRLRQEVLYHPEFT